VSVCIGGGWTAIVSVATVDEFVVVFVITVFSGERMMRGRVVVCGVGIIGDAIAPLGGGIEPAIVGDCCIVPFGMPLVVAGSVNAVVVSAFVPVIGTAVDGGGVSPGPLIVDVTLSV